VSDIEHYLETVDEPTRVAFAHVRDVVTSIEPTVTEGTSYGMPALKYRGKPLLGFKAAQAHLSVFPFSPQAIDAVRDRLDGFSLSKGTIRFSADRPLPDDVLGDVVRYRIGEIDRTR
jgi:uncharacterized protein YdhG (YjbR/CyaY superfamily)